MTLAERTGLDSARRRNAAAALAGGALLAALAFLTAAFPGVELVAVLVPVLLGFGLLELHDRYAAAYGQVGRAGVRLLALGLALAFVAVVFDATTPDTLVKLFLLAVPGVAALVLLVVGSALVALWLSRAGLVDAPTAALFGLSLPLGPLLAALLVAALRPVGVRHTDLLGLPLPLALYGLGWIGLGVHLWTTADADVVVVRDAEAAVEVDLSPHVAVAGVVGAALVALSVGRFVPLGPLSGTPWVGQSLALDLLHLGTGVGGVLVAGSRDRELARRYARSVGPLYLGLVLLGVVALSVGPVAALVAGLRLNLPDLVLHLPAGSLLAAVGYGVDAPSTAGTVAGCNSG